MTILSWYTPDELIEVQLYFEEKELPYEIIATPEFLKQADCFFCGDSIETPIAKEKLLGDPDFPIGLKNLKITASKS